LKDEEEKRVAKVAESGTACAIVKAGDSYEKSIILSMRLGVVKENLCGKFVKGLM
jgi:hypothetical protein